MKQRPFFDRAIDTLSEWAGSSIAVGIALIVVLTWAIATPFIPGGFANQLWQLAINSSTTIVTFVLVFCIQHSTNRETGAILLKLDDLILAIEGADNSIMKADKMTADQIKDFKAWLEAKGEAQ